MKKYSASKTPGTITSLFTAATTATLGTGYSVIIHLLRQAIPIFKILLLRFSMLLCQVQEDIVFLVLLM